MDLALYAFYCTTFVLSSYYIFIFGKFPFPKNQNSNLRENKVSVIICAKNEAKNLNENLPYLISQKFSEFEIILINDGSSDNTLEVMQRFKKVNENIKIVDVKSIETFWGNKKYALTLGIKAATHNKLLFTDADCKPLSNDWINQMCSGFISKKELVIGYSPYKKIKGSLLNLLIRFETFVTALQYMSYAAIAKPYMAVGRNLAYKRKLFFESNGFTEHMNIKSGDDDLFVNQVANSKNCYLQINPNSFVESQPETNFKGWLRQKRRHVSTASVYKLEHQAMLGLFYVAQFFFYLLAIVLLGVSYSWKIVLTLILLKFILQYIMFYRPAKTLREFDLLFILPFLEILLIIFQFSIFILNLISKPRHWK